MDLSTVKINDILRSKYLQFGYVRIPPGKLFLVYKCGLRRGGEGRPFIMVQDLLTGKQDIGQWTNGDRWERI